MKSVSRGTGGKGIRTPDFRLHKPALFPLRYAPCESSSLDCRSRIANLGGGVCDLPICDLGTICSLGKADAGWRSDDLLPGFVRFSAKLRWRARKSGPAFLSLSSRERHRQIRLSRTGDRIRNSFARNLSVVIYALGGFENGRIAAFKIVEVCGVDAVVPNNGTTITVRVA